MEGIILIIDAHQHFWHLYRIRYGWLYGEGVESIRRIIEPPELAPYLQSCGIDKTVLVQSDNSYADTDYMLELAEQYDFIGAVVGWVPLDDPDEAGRKLESLTKNRYFRGVRHLIHDEPDPDWVISDKVLAGLQVLADFNIPFDVVAVFPNHLKHVPTLIEKVPDLKLVIDHLAKPPIKSKGWEPWAEQLKEAAQSPNVFAKVSGLNTAADWPTWSAADLKPYIDYAKSVFGAERLMFGSDWAVAELAGTYGQVWEQTNAAIADYTEAERAAILGGTAQQFYRIDN